MTSINSVRGRWYEHEQEIKIPDCRVDDFAKCFAAVIANVTVRIMRRRHLGDPHSQTRLGQTFEGPLVSN